MDNSHNEVALCASSFTHFSQYLKVKHPTRGLVPLGLYPFQERLSQAYDNHRFVTVSKFRQGGFTTCTILYGLWKCLLSLDERVVFLARTDRDAQAASKVVEVALENLPDFLKPQMGVRNNHEKVFADSGSVMNFFGMGARCGRAATLTIIDEAAYIPDMASHWKSIYPSVSTGGKCFVVSTLSRDDTWFQSLCKSAKDGTNQFHDFVCHYTEHPGYADQAWVARVMRGHLIERGFVNNQGAADFAATAMFS